MGSTVRVFGVVDRSGLRVLRLWALGGVRCVLRVNRPDAPARGERHQQDTADSEDGTDKEDRHDIRHHCCGALSGVRAPAPPRTLALPAASAGGGGGANASR